MIMELKNCPPQVTCTTCEADQATKRLTFVSHHGAETILDLCPLCRGQIVEILSLGRGPDLLPIKDRRARIKYLSEHTSLTPDEQIALEHLTDGELEQMYQEYRFN